MSVNSDGKHQVGRPLILTRVASRVLCEKAFTLIELLIVITTIGVMIGAATIVWDATARNMNVQTSAEMLKEDIRGVYTRAGLGVGVVDSATGIKYRDQYMLEINTKTGSPPNCYRIRTRTWNGAAYGLWTTVTPRSTEANQVSDGWIKPSSMSNMNIDILSNGESMGVASYQIIFESKGSIIQTQSSGDIVIRLSSPSKRTDVTVSVYGDAS